MHSRTEYHCEACRSSFGLPQLQPAECLWSWWGMLPCSAYSGSVGTAIRTADDHLLWQIFAMQAYLNGVAIPELLSLRTLIAKLVGTCCSVAANMTLGPEAPMVRICSLWQS